MPSFDYKSFLPVWSTPLLFTLSASAFAYVVLCLLLYRYQTKLIFRPLPQIMQTPADVGCPYEDVWISLKPQSGKLHAWWMPNPKTPYVMLFCHGNYGNISFNLERLAFFYEVGFSVLAFDYRGYGRSTGPGPTELSTYSDAQAAWRYLTREQQIDPNLITLCGHSIGGAVAIHLASQQPEVKRLVVSSTFTNMLSAIDTQKRYRFIPVEQLLAHPFDSIQKVKSLDIPVLYVHGQDDPDVPAYMSQTLYDLTPHPKRIWLVPGADHNSIVATQPDTYADVLQEFCFVPQAVPNTATVQR